MIEQLLELASDKDFYQLQQKQLNVFEILNIQGKEVFISSALAWILNPKSPHGYGGDFLVKIIQETFKKEPELLVKLLAFDPENTSVFTEYVLPSGRRIDILIRDKKNGVVLGIENKIYSSENNDQTIAYEEDFQLLFHNETYGLVYLALNMEEKPQGKQFIQMTHQQFNDAILDIIKTRRSVNEEAVYFIQQYVRSVNISMNTSKEQELCKALYKQYPEAVTLLAKTISEMWEEMPKLILGRLEKLICEKGEFSFKRGKLWLAVYPKEWVNLFGSDDWSDIHHEFFCKENKLYLVFHVENGMDKQIKITSYSEVKVCSFDTDDIENIKRAAQLGYDALLSKHNEMKMYVQDYLNKKQL